MKKIYRTVSVNDEDGVKGRMPEKIEKRYHLLVNESYECTGILFIDRKDNTKKFYEHWYDHQPIDNVTHWQEEIEKPSDELIEKIRSKYKVNSSDTDIYNVGLIRGMKLMRDLIFKNK